MWVPLALLLLTTTTCFLCIIAAIIDCLKTLSDKDVRIINLSVQIAYLLPLSIFSMYITHNILQKLTTDSN